MTTSRRLIVFVVACSMLALASCKDESKVTPRTSGDHRPRIGLSPQVVDEGAVAPLEIQTIDSCSATGGCAFPLHVTRYSQVRLLGKIIDRDAGIKSVSLSVTQAGSTLYSLHLANQPGSDGLVAGEFGFAGSDNAGGFGVLAPITFAAIPGTQIVLEAVNFEGNVNKLIVDVIPHDPVQARIAIQPGEINAGQSAQITIAGSPNTERTLSPFVDTQFGTGTVSPAATTTYSFTVKQPFAAATVSFPNPPPATGHTVASTSKTVTATLTVHGGGGSPQGPIELAFYLALQPVGASDRNYGWKSTFGLSAPGTIVAIRNLGPRQIELMQQGSTVNDCFTAGNLNVKLAVGQTTTATEVSQLYGAANYPRDIGACALVPPGESPPVSLPVVVTYTH